MRITCDAIDHRAYQSSCRGGPRSKPRPRKNAREKNEGKSDREKAGIRKEMRVPSFSAVFPFKRLQIFESSLGIMTERVHLPLERRSFSGGNRGALEKNDLKHFF